MDIRLVKSLKFPRLPPSSTPLLLSSLLDLLFEVKLDHEVLIIRTIKVPSNLERCWLIWLSIYGSVVFCLTITRNYRRRCSLLIVI